MSALLPEGWKFISVEKLKSSEPRALAAGPFGSSISSKFFVDDGVPVIRGGNLSKGKERFITSAFVFITPSKANKFKGAQVKAGDLVFTCWGTLGQVGLIPKSGPYEKYVISNKQLKLRPDSEIVSSEFLYYYFSSPTLRQRFNDVAIGAAVPGINLGILRREVVPLPRLKVQKKIAAILTAYDDLIEVNKRRIALLEKMAEELYREWFVRIRFPGHQNTRFVKGVPEGWKIVRVDSLGKVITGKTPSTSVPRYYNSQYPFIKTPDMHGNMFILESNESLSEDGVRSQPSQTIPENSLCVSCIGTGGIVSITTTTSQTNQQINSVCLNRREDLEWGYFLLRGLKETIRLFGSTGTTMTNLSKGKFSGLKLFSPPKELRDEFHIIVETMFSEIRVLTFANRNITKTRDLLLPRLISGKLSVEDLDIQFPPSMQAAMQEAASERDPAAETSHA